MVVGNNTHENSIRGNYMKKLITIAILGVLVATGQAIPASASASTQIAQATFIAPTNIKTNDQTPSSVGLSWTAVPNAPQYRIQYSKNPNMSQAQYARSIANNANADIRDLEAGTQYYFKVKVIQTDGTEVGPYSVAFAASTKEKPPALPAIQNPLKVASFNIRGANYASTPQETSFQPWTQRRGAIISNITSNMPDVIGLQEASKALLKDGAGKDMNLSQFEDLHNRLKQAGAPYEITNGHRNNCVDSTTTYKCVYADKGASQDSRIFYNRNTVTLVSQGSVQLPLLEAKSSPRFVAWAIFKQKSTNREFFVANTHLQPENTPAGYNARKVQAQKVVETINAKNPDKLPVFIVGDMNASKWAEPHNEPYNIYTQAGYIDPVGGTAKTSLASGYATAEVMKNAEYSTFNGFKRELGKTSVVSPRALGSHIDYIFTSKMRVSKWEQIVNVDKNGQLQGTIPSDHNMIMATVEVPAYTSFVDVKPSTAFYKEIEWLAGKNITTGWGDRTYRPTASIQRDAMAAFLYRYAGSPDYTPPTKSKFKDVAPSNEFYKEINWLHEQGISTGWADGTYRPTAPIERGAMAAFLYRYADFPAYTAPAKSRFKDITPSSDFYKEINWLHDQGISTGWADNTYRSVSPVQRDAMAAFLYRFDQKQLR